MSKLEAAYLKSPPAPSSFSLYKIPHISASYEPISLKITGPILEALNHPPAKFQVSMTTNDRIITLLTHPHSIAHKHCTVRSSPHSSSSHSAPAPPPTP